VLEATNFFVGDRRFVVVLLVVAALMGLLWFRRR
jgi:hypothetical protein